MQDKLKTNRRFRQKRKRLGLCLWCPSPVGDLSKQLCDSCQKRRRKYHNKFRNLKRQQHLCIECSSKLVVGNGVRCQGCSKKIHLAYSRRAKERLKTGTCLHCSEKALSSNTVLCLQHWLKRMARTATKQSSDAASILDLLEKQSYRCVYSNKVLVPSINASIDHIVPLSRGGTKTLSNIQWVDITVNKMKHNLTHVEFVNLTRLLYHTMEGLAL